MNKPSLKSPLLLLACITSPAMAIENQTTLCTLQGMERKIEIVYPNKTAIPCEVQYTKQGEMQVLWAAQGQPGYCEEQAAAFIEKQRGWGWQCDTQDADQPARKVEEDSRENDEMIESMSR